MSNQQHSAIGAHMQKQAMDIASVFLAEKITGDLGQMIQGPVTLIYRVALHAPSAAVMNKVTAPAFREALEASLRVSPVMVSLSSGIVEIETPSPWPQALDASDLHGEGWRVPLGVTGRRVGQEFELATVDLSLPQSAHLLAVGPTGAGKTVGVKALCYHMARQSLTAQNKLRPLKFAVACHPTKERSWADVARLPQTVAVVTQPAEIKRMLQYFAHMAKTRRVPQPPWIVIVDDLMALLQDVDITKELIAIAANGREPRVHLVVLTQRLGTQGAGGAAVTGSIRTRLVVGAADAQDAAAFRGFGGDSIIGQLSGKPGDAVLVANGREQRVIISAVGQDEWFSLYAKLGGTPVATPQAMRPWMRWQSPVTGAGAGGDKVSPYPGQTLSPGSDGDGDAAAVTRIKEKARELGLGDLPLRGERDRSAELALLRYAYYELREQQNLTLRTVLGDKNPRYAKRLKEALG